MTHAHAFTILKRHWLQDRYNTYSMCGLEKPSAKPLAESRLRLFFRVKPAEVSCEKCLIVLDYLLEQGTVTHNAQHDKYTWHRTNNRAKTLKTVLALLAERWSGNK